MMTRRHSSYLIRVFNILVWVVLFLLSCSEKKSDNSVIWIKPEKLEEAINRADYSAKRVVFDIILDEKGWLSKLMQLRKKTQCL